MAKKLVAYATTRPLKYTPELLLFHLALMSRFTLTNFAIISNAWAWNKNQLIHWSTLKILFTWSASRTCWCLCRADRVNWCTEWSCYRPYWHWTLLWLANNCDQDQVVPSKPPVRSILWPTGESSIEFLQSKSQTITILQYYCKMFCKTCNIT